jgi:hypothetical protein
MKPKQRTFDIAVSLKEGVCLRGEDQEWVFMRRLRNGRLVPAEMPVRISKQIARMEFV